MRTIEWLSTQFHEWLHRHGMISFELSMDPYTEELTGRRRLRVTGTCAHCGRVHVMADLPL